MAATSAAPIVWQRFSSGQRLARFAIYFVIVAAVVTSIKTIEVIPEFLLDAPEQMQDLLVRMWPPEISYYRKNVHEALLETIHIASLGTLLSVLLALPFGLMAARNVTPVPLLNYVAKFVLVSSRSVNSLVWALLFVGIFGPGALAGTLAIAFRSIGFVGKLIGEALEEANPGPLEALTAAGADTGKLLWYGYWPQIKPAFFSILLLRWDINVRESAVLGLVGAGGIGMAMQSSIDLFQWTRVSVILLAIFTVVVIGEIAITAIRKRIL